MFNAWFMQAAPKAFRETRAAVTGQVEQHLVLSEDGRKISGSMLIEHPVTLATLRMATAPPLARERLSGLAGVSLTTVKSLEDGKIPRMPRSMLLLEADKLSAILLRLMDDDLFPWLSDGTTPSEVQRYRAATIVADRRCGAVADPIVKNAQEKRQIALIQAHLEAKGYQLARGIAEAKKMPPGTFSFRMNVPVHGGEKSVNIPVDVVIQPHNTRSDRMPILIECKSAGDYTNVNKRRKEEAQKAHQIRATYGADVPFYLFLCGYFNSQYLGYSAAEGIDWIWEHRIADLDEVGL